MVSQPKMTRETTHHAGWVIFNVGPIETVIVVGVLAMPPAIGMLLLLEICPVSEFLMLGGTPHLGHPEVVTMAGGERKIEPGMPLHGSLEMAVPMKAQPWLLMQESGRRNRSGWIEIGIPVPRRMVLLVTENIIHWLNTKIWHWSNRQKTPQSRW